MITQCSIWIGEDDFEKIIEKIKNHDESVALYEGHDIGELFIEPDGSMYGFISVGDIGVGIHIPFGEWFSEFVKFKSFKTMLDFMERHREKLDEAIDETYGILNQIHDSKERLEKND